MRKVLYFYWILMMALKDANLLLEAHLHAIHAFTMTINVLYFIRQIFLVLHF